MRIPAIKKIAFLSNTSWSIYNFRLGLIRKLSAEGYQVIIICPMDQYTPKLKQEPCTFIPVQLSRHKINPFLDFRYFLQVFKILSRYRPDFVVSYTIKPNIYGQIAARLLKINRLAVVTGLGYLFINQTWKTQLVKTLYRLSFKSAKRVWFLNKDDQALFLTNKIVQKAQVGYLPGEGVDINYFAPRDRPSNKALCFTYAGRLIKEKGVPEFIGAAQLLKTWYPNIQFQVAGFIENEAPGAIRLSDITKWEKAGIISFKGPRDDIRPILAGSDCVVLPTYYREGVPRILLEAASMGIIIIGTNTPGCKDIIFEGKNGFLCQPRNPEHLASTLLKVIHLSDAERQHFGQSGREIVVANFREEKIIDRYLELFSTVFGFPVSNRSATQIKID